MDPNIPERTRSKEDPRQRINRMGMWWAAARATHVASSRCSMLQNDRHSGASVCRSTLFACAALIIVVLVSPPSHAAGSKCQHTVKKGDTASRIARKYGVTEKHLIAANPELKKNPNRLRIGQSLDICRARRRARTRPSKCKGGGRIVTHSVGPKETLGGIAAHYEVSHGLLKRYNPRLKSRPNNMIRVGETLRVCTTLRRYTHRSWFKDGVQLPEGDGYNVRRPGNAWGTATTIDNILGAIAHYRELEPDAPVVQVGDISRRNGGPLREHLSHQEGRDVDIGYVFEHRDDGSKVMDLSRTWTLVRSFAEVDDVAVIFMDYDLQKRLYDHAASLGVDEAELRRLFDYPRNDGEAVFHHWPGHGRHFHVRFNKGNTHSDKGQPADERDSPEAQPNAQSGARSDAS